MRSRRTLMQPWSRDYAGRIDEHVISSDVLAGNPLGDPAERPLWVYVPPGYHEDRTYPTVYVIQGLTGQIDMWRGRAAFRPNYIELMDDLFTREQAPPAVVVFVDAWTSLGGSQFLNSRGTGRYHDYLCEEVVAFVDERYRTDPRPGRRGIQGKSSGGYGALVTPMLRPDVFGALASHAGDALFEACYLPDFRRSVRALRDEYDGSFDRFWEDFRSRPAFSKDSDGHLLNDWCMAACYSAEEDGSVTLPYDVATGRLRDDVWERWLARDPVRMIPGHADALRSLTAIYVDAGRKDEFFLDLGAEAVKRELDSIGVACEFDLFDAGHGAIEYRYPRSLAFLCRALSNAA
jgi:S-formylglutathione hydrolase FrmB